MGKVLGRDLVFPFLDRAQAAFELQLAGDERGESIDLLVAERVEGLGAHLHVHIWLDGDVAEVDLHGTFAVTHVNGNLVCLTCLFGVWTRDARSGNVRGLLLELTGHMVLDEVCG